MQNTIATKRAEPKAMVLLVLAVLITIAGNSQQNTVGLIYDEGEAYDAYTLFSPGGNTYVYLIDNDGRIMHQWESEYRPGNAVYLQEDGSLYRAGHLSNQHIQAGGAGGIVEKFSWQGILLWSYTISDMNFRAHHDFHVMPNGNLLLLVWENIEMEEVVANGRNPELMSQDKLWPEMILEIKPTGRETGDIVWEWHAWDHLVQNYDETKVNYGTVVGNPGKIDLNYVEEGKLGADWHHANSIDYNADLDQIMISVLRFDEVWIIDHNSTTEEAKGDKGDLLFRWGNPITYGAGSVDDQKLFGQHNAQWIQTGLPDEDKILIFNNGKDRPDGDYTTVLKIDPTLLEDGNYQKSAESRFLPITFDYEYVAEVPTDFYSSYISGVQQLPNGNLLINDGAHGTFFEIDENEEEVWRYINPVTSHGIVRQGEDPLDSKGRPTNPVFRALKYGKDYTAFINRDLVPGEFIEFERVVGIDMLDSDNPRIYPNPATSYFNIKSQKSENNLQLINMSGQVVIDKQIDSWMISVNVNDLPRGIYVVLLNQEPAGRLLLD